MCTKMPDCRISTGNCEIAINTSHLPAEISQSVTSIQVEEEREKCFLSAVLCNILNGILSKKLKKILSLKDQL